MSRSYRAPWYTDGYKGSKNRQYYKRQANRVIRRTASEIADGKAFRKLFESWSICDYKWLYDPKPRIYMYGGEQRIVEPSPIWRVARK